MVTVYSFRSDTIISDLRGTVLVFRMTETGAVPLFLFLQTNKRKE